VRHEPGHDEAAAAPQVAAAARRVEQIARSALKS
jgi:hypothetical protein